MTWQERTFVEWPCWESGPFRIMRTEDGSYRLFRDKFIATDVWSGFRTLEEAKSKAQECLT
jgi:hypothetical protein